MRDPRWVRAMRFGVLFVLTLFTVVPLYVMVVSSVKPLADVEGLFTFWPSVITVSPALSPWLTMASRPLVRAIVTGCSATV